MNLSTKQKERFLKIIESSPKHIGQSLLREKNKDLLEWVNSHELPFETTTLTEKVYLIVSGIDPICKNNKKKTFMSWTSGYAPGCGRPGLCACVHELVNSAHHRKIKKLQTDQNYKKKIGKKISKKLNRYYTNASEEELMLRYDNVKKSLQDEKVKEKRAKTKIEKGQQIDPKDRTAKEEYYYQVGLITANSYRDHYDEINPLGLPRNEYHLDHIFSRIEGFIQEIPPEIIGHWKNLQMLPEVKNKEKSRRCDHTLEELLEKISKN